MYSKIDDKLLAKRAHEHVAYVNLPVGPSVDVRNFSALGAAADYPPKTPGLSDSKLKNFQLLSRILKKSFYKKYLSLSGILDHFRPLSV